MTRHPSLYRIFSLLFAVFSATSLAQAEPEPAAELSAEEQYLQWAQAMWDSFEPQTGSIELANGAATIDVPDSFYFLNAQDSAKVLTEVWGNPPSSAEGILGMLFPADYTPFDQASWGVTIEYEQDGYVSDEDAEDIDYAQMLRDMQEDTLESSKARVQQGYEAIQLVGWATPPYYDAQTHKLHWAKEIRFGDAPINTLNYNIRVLGRQGVLVMNFIAGMDQLDQVNAQVDSVLAMADFNQGSRYADFDPDIDQVAAYGLGALVAGKVAAKVGLLATVLLMLKKFWFVVLIGLGALAKLFKRKPKDPQ